MPQGTGCCIVNGMMRLWRLIGKQFSNLRWKLTLSYFGVTVAALLIAGTLVILGLSAYVVSKTRVTPEELFLDITSGSYNELGRQFLSSFPPDVEGLADFLSQFRATVAEVSPIEIGDFVLNVTSTNVLYVIYTDAEGNLIDSVPHDLIQNSRAGQPLDTDEIPGLRGPFEAALAGEVSSENLINKVNNDLIIGAIPIYHINSSGDIVGVLGFVHKSRLLEVMSWPQISRQVGISLLFIALIAGIFGILFGFATARGLTSRLYRVGSSAEAWSQGDFSVFVDDPINDELGNLGNTLNHMAAQLESLLEERQEISAIEERNRLARDLHDSVKQQAFAASAQLAAARTQMNPEPPQAVENLDEAERLVNEVRKELTNLIQELRPGALQDKGLVPAIQKYAQECENQMCIPILVRAQGTRSIPRELEQSLFRIVQGAISNVARHSRASEAEISLTYQPDQVILTISDNGVGFDPNKKYSGMGLRSILERIDLLDGELIVESDKECGTKITAICKI